MHVVVQAGDNKTGNGSVPEGGTLNAALRAVPTAATPPPMSATQLQLSTLCMYKAHTYIGYVYAIYTE